MEFKQNNAAIRYQNITFYEFVSNEHIPYLISIAALNTKTYFCHIIKVWLFNYPMKLVQEIKIMN